MPIKLLPLNRGARRELAFLTGAGALAATFLKRDKSLALTLGIGAAALLFWPGKRVSFRGKSVVITGGSRGLGFALAQTFLREGARLTLLARNGDDLLRAEAQLREQFGGDVATIPCDITKPAALREALKQAEERHGRIDVLVNNANAITIGPFATMDQRDFGALLNLQVQAVVNAVQATLPAFRRAGGGHVINISSIGGKIAVPHMSTYCASKFALAGLSENMGTELSVDNVKVTTVFPGLMRLGSAIQAVIKGDHEKEYAWFAAGDVLPGASVSSRYAARRIVEAARHGDAQVIFPSTVRLAALAHETFPELFALVMRTAAQFFPRGTSTERKTGEEVKGWLENQSWYALLKPLQHGAESRLNQRGRWDADFNLGN